MLLLMGISAAALMLLPEMNLRVPGHAILRSIFPMACGLALVPRQGSGTVMGLGAMGTVLIAWLCGGPGIGRGATTSLALMGPMLDFAVSMTRRGWHLYLALMLAGLGTNLAALAVRGTGKGLGGGTGGGRSMTDWWASAMFTYPVCGILAGLLSAVVWFKLRETKKPSSDPEAAS